MSYTIVPLGNPGDTYAHTRHNAGRIAVEDFYTSNDFSMWKEDKKKKALVAEGVVCGEDVTIIEPNASMNVSGSSLTHLAGAKKKLAQLILVHDEIDLPLGTVRVSFARGSGGHQGVESVMKKVRSKDFIRLRVGIAKVAPSGNIKKPRGKDEVVDFVLGAFSAGERQELKKIGKEVTAIIETIIDSGVERAMNTYNQAR